MTRLLTQPQYKPQAIMDQVIAIFAGNSGFLDDLPVEETDHFEAGLVEYVETVHAEFYEDLVADKTLDADRKKRLRLIANEYKEGEYRRQRRARRREAEAAEQTDSAGASADVKASK